MTPSTYTYETTWFPPDSDEPEVEVTLTYRVTSWGCKARIRYDENDYPAEGPELYVTAVKRDDGTPVSPALQHWADTSNHLFEDLLAEAVEIELNERDEALQRHGEERRERDW